jgi:type II secretory pathway pseudopilin PulG
MRQRGAPPFGGNHGFTIVELTVVVAICALLIGVLVPALSTAHDRARVQESKSNLRQLGVAHTMYAADWADRHVTLVRDNLGQYGGDVVKYTQEVYGGGIRLEAHPPILGGRGYTSGGRYTYWGVWANRRNRVYFQPINFPGPPHEEAWPDGWGWFLFANQAKPMHDYLTGRFHDPVLYAPKDRWVLDRIEPCFELPGEFVGGVAFGGIAPAACNSIRYVTSYCLSPAGLFDPQVFSGGKKNGGFWRPPWEMPSGYRVPTFAQVRYPTLKTHMLEHHWLQNATVACNDAFTGCEPYYFNHSYRSAPVTIFYDGSVRLVGVLEAMSADERMRHQAGHGLWSRDTPFGEDGYMISDGYDFAATGFHILTIDGVRGRDTLGPE